MSAVHDLHEFRVGAVREFFVDFKGRADLFDLHILDSIHKYHRVGISHGHAGKTVLFSIHSDRLPDLGGLHRTPHIHRHKLYLAVF